jgi:uncharacterized protein
MRMVDSGERRDEAIAKPSRRPPAAEAPKVMARGQRVASQLLLYCRSICRHNCEVPPRTPMQAYVYKSRRKSDTYVYLRERDGFGLIPEPLLGSLGTLDFVMEVALTPERKLAREDATVVRSNLAKGGFHLQLPPAIFSQAPAVENPRDMAAHIASSTDSMNAVDEPGTEPLLRGLPAQGARHGDA